MQQNLGRLTVCSIVDVVSNAVVILLADIRDVALNDVLEQQVALVPLVVLSLQLIDLGASEERQLLCSRHQRNLFESNQFNRFHN